MFRWLFNRGNRMDSFKLLVKTGNQEHAGTDANVWVVIEDGNGLQTEPVKLDAWLYDDLERGTLDYYSQLIPNNFSKVHRVRITRDTQGHSDDWFCDYIIIQDPRGHKDPSDFRKITNSRCPGIIDSSYNGFPSEAYFPVCRWITANHEYTFDLFGVSLPKNDVMADLRLKDLEGKREQYKLTINIGSGPAQAANMPSDEKFSEEYYWNFATEKAKLLAKTTFIKWTTKPWRSIEELKCVMKKALGETRQSMAHWDTDEWFGYQRLQGVNPYVLSLCKELPQNLDVTEETVSGLLGDLSLQEALKRNRIFICDLKILEGVRCKNDRKLAAPLALFFLKNDDELLPIAIQLQQQKGPNNPVFTPKDDPSTWLVAKMYYNNAEGQHHQGVSHLGLTHLLMEGICVCSHRQLSPSHPIFKLMAPHFLFLIAINTRGLEKLISPGGWVDCCMTQGICGIYEVIRRGINNHNFFKHGSVPEEIEGRGLLDPDILPYYPYRDDAVSLYEVIRKYVTKVIHHYYDSEDKLRDDWELREWRLELSQPRESGGVGLVGVPGDDEKGFSSTEEVIDTVTIILSTCSLGHAAANFQQYEQFGFVPNYPGLLMKDPPTEKVTYTENDILELLPDMHTTLSMMVITKLLSKRGTNSLGDFEMQYLYHPIDIQAAEEFRKDLKILSLENKKLNLNRKLLFDWLDPEIIPNSISI